MSRKTITRRDFIRAAAVAPIAGAVGCCCLGTAAKIEEDSVAGTARIIGTVRRSKVVLVRDARAVGEGRKIDAAVVQNMLDDAVMTLFGEKDRRLPGGASSSLPTPSASRPTAGTICPLARRSNRPSAGGSWKRAYTPTASASKTAAF